MSSSGADGRYECTTFFPDIPNGGRWLHLTVSLIRDTGGNLTGAMETIEDVTSLKEGQFVIQQ
jgi:DUF438 domain-containing protein